MRERALAVREGYEEYERRTYGRPWSLEELTLGLVGDVGDLAKLVQVREGVRVGRERTARRSSTSSRMSCGR